MFISDKEPPLPVQDALPDSPSSTFNIGDKVFVSLPGTFQCAGCWGKFARKERLFVAVCRPDRQEIEPDVVEYVLCSATCMVEFMRKKENTEWRNTKLGWEDKGEETPRREKPGSLWGRFRGLVDGTG